MDIAWRAQDVINHLWLGRIQGPTYYKPLLLAALLFPPALFFLNFGDSSLPRVAHETERHLTRKPSSVFVLSSSIRVMMQKLYLQLCANG